MVPRNSEAPTWPLLRSTEVLRMIGLSRSKLYNKIKRKEFPQQVSLNSPAVGWIEQEVQEWIDLRAHLRLGQEPEIHPARASESARVVPKKYPHLLASPSSGPVGLRSEYARAKTQYWLIFLGRICLLP